MGGGVCARTPWWSVEMFGAERIYTGKLLSGTMGVRPGEVLATRLHVFNISAGFSGLQLITRTFLNFFVYFAIALHYCAMIRLVHGSPKSPTGVGLKPHVHLFLIINQEEGTAQCPPTPN